MQTLLQINSSIYTDDGQSTRLVNRLVARWQAATPGGRIILRDLAKEPVPHLDVARFSAFTSSPEARTPEQAAVVRYSDELIAELRQADVIVLGLPMYNFAVPSTLKAYIDHVARAGQTFRYTATGSIGLLTGKTAIVIATRGGRHAGTPGDSQTPYMQTVLGFFGIDDVRFVYAEGLAMGDDSRREALARAEAEIDSLPVAVRAAA